MDQTSFVRNARQRDRLHPCPQTETASLNSKGPSLSSGWRLVAFTEAERHADVEVPIAAFVDWEQGELFPIHRHIVSAAGGAEWSGLGKAILYGLGLLPNTPWLNSSWPEPITQQSRDLKLMLEEELWLECKMNLKKSRQVISRYRNRCGHSDNDSRYSENNAKNYKKKKGGGFQNLKAVHSKKYF